MRIKKIITITITAVSVLMIVFSGIMKLAGNDTVVSSLTKVGVEKYILWLGISEIVFAILFVFPKTMKAGFLLLSCYLAGAMATELSHSTPLNALGPIILLWIAAFLRDKSIFFTTNTSEY